MAQTPRGLLMKQKKTARFDQVTDQIHKLHDLNFDDQVVELKDIKVIPDRHDKKPEVIFEVPRIGRLTLTDWAKGQIGRMLGVNFDKWFDPKNISAKEIQEEMTRRFSRTGQAAKIRARQFQKGDPGRKRADGFARAFLSPSYAPIDDVRMFDRMGRRFRGQLEDMAFIKNHLGTDYFNDRSSHYTVVGEPVNLGPIDRKHPDKRVRDIYDIAEREGMLPDTDWVYQGFHFRNSEVGHTAVTIDSSTFRLVCLNGMIMTVQDGRLLYRMHRAIDNEQIDGLLDETFRKMPAAWETNRKRMVALQEKLVDDAVKEIEKFLERQKASKKLTQVVKDAYEAEPLGNRYGVLQAITRAAHKETDMDRRFELEEMAGRYMALAA